MNSRDHPEPVDLLADMRNGEWLDAQTFAPLRYAVPGFIPEGLTLFAGPPKVGKSWFLLAVTLGVASGGYVLGSVQVPQRPVLYLALEDGDRRMQDRCRTLMSGQPIPPFDYLTKVAPGSVLATIKAWLTIHGDKSPVVILDTLGKVMPPALHGESAYQRDYRIGSALKRLADEHPGASVIVNHHVRKAASEDFVDSISGTNGLAGAADTIITLSRARNETAGLLKVTGRDVLEAEYALTFSSGGVWTLDGGSAEAAMQGAELRRATINVGDRMTEVITAVHQAGKPVRAFEVAKLVGMSPDDAGKYLRRAADKGQLIKAGRGQFLAPLPPSEVSECPIEPPESDTPPTSDRGYSAREEPSEQPHCCEGGPWQLRCQLCPRSASYWRTRRGTDESA